MILIDTDHLTVLMLTRDARHLSLVERLRKVEENVATTIVNVEEQLRGWLARIAGAKDPSALVIPYRRLAELIRFQGQWSLVEFDEVAVESFKMFRRQKIRIGTQDLKIASIAVTNDALLLTANDRDFSLVPGLRTENWLK